jgi:N-acetylmuramoyl-L-alanine amidase
MNTTIDHRDHDQHESGLTLEQRLRQPVFDLKIAQQIREKMRAQGMRVPLTDAEEFAEAERRFKESTAPDRRDSISAYEQAERDYHHHNRTLDGQL